MGIITDTMYDERICWGCEISNDFLFNDSEHEPEFCCPPCSADFWSLAPLVNVQYKRIVKTVMETEKVVGPFCLMPSWYFEKHRRHSKVVGV